VRDWTLGQILTMDPPEDPDEVRIVAIKLAEALQAVASGELNDPAHFATAVLVVQRDRLSQIPSTRRTR
jgi:hypothetical protein